MGDGDLRVRERIGVDAETVILRGNLDFAGLTIEHRMVGSVMAELELECLAAERETENLVAKADAEDGNFADELLNLAGLRFERLRIARTVR